MECYLDNSATTRAYPEVAALVSDIMLNTYGNPSSMHMKGVEGLVFTGLVCQLRFQPKA